MTPEQERALLVRLIDVNWEEAMGGDETAVRIVDMALTRLCSSLGLDRE
jgi:hypothetical protein